MSVQHACQFHVWLTRGCCQPRLPVSRELACAFNTFMKTVMLGTG